MAISLAALTANAMANAITTYVGTSGKLRIYGGSAPANADAALSSNPLLVDFTLDATAAFGAAASGTITLAGVPMSVAASTSGTATFFRILKSDGTTVVLQGTVGTSGQQLNLNTTSIVSGVNVTVTSGTITMPT
jgi:hypothetical protein